MQTFNEQQARPLIGATEVARLVGLTRSTFYRYVHQDAFPNAAVKVKGCEMLFGRAALLRWLEGQAA